MITFPTTPLDYQFAPWTDPNGIQWIYNATKTRWARYRVASTGGVSSFNDLTDVPAALTTPQAAATPSIRAIGTGATDAAAGNHTHPLPTPADIGAVDADDIPALSESIVSNAVAAVSESGAYVASTGGTMTNGTLSGTLTAGALTTDATTKTNLQSAIGATATGVSAITAANAASLATAAGHGTADSPTMGGLHVSNTLGNANLRITNSSVAGPNNTWLVSAGIAGTSNTRFAIMQNTTSNVYLQIASPSEAFAGNFGIGQAPDATAKFNVNGAVKGTGIISTGTLIEGVYTVGTTPTHVLGAAIRISSVTGAAIGAAVTTGGGSGHVVARSNGTQWICTEIIIP